MKRLPIMGLGLILALALTGSCIITVVDYGPSGYPKADEYEKSLPLPMGGTVSLNNIKGDIEIRGWERAQVDIFAEKLMPIPRETKVRILRWDRSLPDIDVDRLEDHVRIRTRPARDREASPVNYYLSVPEAVNLKDITAESGSIFVYDLYGESDIELKEGDIQIDNFSGSLNASVVTGSVKARLYDLREEDVIRIDTQRGDVTVFLQPQVGALIEAEAQGGEIISDFDLGLNPPANKVSASIGETGAKLSLSTLDGNVYIRMIKE